MIESPVLQRLREEWTREAQRRLLVGILNDRFGAVPEGLDAELETIADEAQLKDLVKSAVTCVDLEAFRKRLKP